MLQQFYQYDILRWFCGLGKYFCGLGNYKLGEEYLYLKRVPSDVTFSKYICDPDNIVNMIRSNTCTIDFIPSEATFTEHDSTGQFSVAL